MTWADVILERLRTRPETWSELKGVWQFKVGEPRYLVIGKEPPAWIDGLFKKGDKEAADNILTATPELFEAFIDGSVVPQLAFYQGRLAIKGAQMQIVFFLQKVVQS